MDLETRERLQLAAFFAKRWPTAEHRVSFATSARLQHQEPPETDPEAGWELLISAAVAEQALPRLARVTADSAPGDENLQQLCRVLAPPDRRPVLLGVALGGGVGAVLVAAMAALAVIGTWTSPEPELTAAVQLDAAPASAVHTDAALPTVLAFDEQAALLDDATPTEQDPAGSAVVLADAAEPTAARAGPAPVAAALAKTRSQPAPGRPTAAASGWTASQDPVGHRGHCRSGDDGVVGYWYAGTESPGSTGDVIEMPHSVNVRADYPDSHNGFDARTAIRCTLVRGERVKLSQQPIEVPGDAWWVPLASGDLVGEDGTAEL